LKLGRYNFRDRADALSQRTKGGGCRRHPRGCSRRGEEIGGCLTFKECVVVKLCVHWMLPDFFERAMLLMLCVIG
jgi:hypothetical protein